MKQVGTASSFQPSIGRAPSQSPAQENTERWVASIPSEMSAPPPYFVSGGSQRGSQRGSETAPPGYNPDGRGLGWGSSSITSSEVRGKGWWRITYEQASLRGAWFFMGVTQAGGTIWTWTGGILVGGVALVLSLYFLLNILQWLDVFRFVSSFLSQGVLASFAANTNLTEPCAPCPIQTCSQFN